MAENKRHLRLVPDEITVAAKPINSCYSCEFAMFGPRGTYCSAFSEEIWDEIGAAEDCDLYEELA